MLIVTVAVLALQLGLPAGFPRGVTTSDAASGCPTVTFIGVRGSGETLDTRTNDVGPTVDVIARAFKSYFRSGGSVLIQGDTYPAEPVSDLEPSSAQIRDVQRGAIPAALVSYELGIARYFASIQTGIRDAVSEANAAVNACPLTLLVLAGYSQGAMVVHQAELQLAASGNTRVTGRIAGTLLIADGDRVPHTRATEFGTSSHSAQGIRPYTHLIAAQDVPFPASTANICSAGDFVCNFNIGRIPAWSSGFDIHTSYATQQRGLLGQAALWLSNKIKAGPGNLKIYVYGIDCVSQRGPTCTNTGPLSGATVGVSMPTLLPGSNPPTAGGPPIYCAQRQVVTDSQGLALFTGCPPGLYQFPIIEKPGWQFGDFRTYFAGYVKGARTISTVEYMRPCASC